MAYRARLRFRVSKNLRLPDHRHAFHVGGREVILSSALDEEKTIAESNWLVLNSRGFATEDDAQKFGHHLISALRLSSAATRLGVDAGKNRPTSAVSLTVKEEVAQQTGTLLRDNVHGLDVFPDVPKTAIVSVHATGSVSVGAEPFLSSLSELHGSVGALSKPLSDAVLLLNYALMSAEAVAQIVLAVSAIEMLGQDRTAWTANQKRILKEVSTNAQDSSIGTGEEWREIAEAISKLHRVSLRQGVIRLLVSLGLDDLTRQWDDLYAERSGLVHGEDPTPGADYGDLAYRTVSLCGRILLYAVGQEVPSANRHVQGRYV